MWLYTQHGCYSAVVYRDGMITVRSRFRSHLVALKRRFPHAFRNSVITPTPKRDYPYRMGLPQQLWADVVAALVMEQDYSNFKSKVKATVKGPDAAAYNDLLHAVWWAGVRGSKSKGVDLYGFGGPGTAKYL